MHGSVQCSGAAGCTAAQGQWQGQLPLPRPSNKVHHTLQGDCSAVTVSCKRQHTAVQVPVGQQGQCTRMDVFGR